MQAVLNQKSSENQMVNNTSRLHHELITFAGQYSSWADVRHMTVMRRIMVGLIAEGSVNLTQWQYHIQTKATIPKEGSPVGLVNSESYIA
jgi:hypothetical protein